MNNILKILIIFFLSVGTISSIGMFGLKIFFEDKENNELIVLGPDNVNVILKPKDPGGLKVSNLDIEILNNKSALKKDEKIRPLPDKPELLPIDIIENENNETKEDVNAKGDQKLSESKKNNINKPQNIDDKNINKLKPITDDKLKPATDKIGLYRVQFGSFRNFKKATQAKEKMDKKYSNLLTDVKLEVFTYTNDKAASFYRVWTTPLTKDFGLELCNKFKKQKVVCILQINN